MIQHSECELLVCVGPQTDVNCELCTYTHKSSVILLDSLNSFIRSSLHTIDCTWTSPTKSGQETRELSLVQKAVKYSIVSQHKGQKEANTRLGRYTIKHYM